MRSTAFPVTIQLEVETKKNEWEVMVTFLCNNNESLTDKFKIIKSLYVLDNKSYRVMLILQSKLNSRLL